MTIQRNAACLVLKRLLANGRLTAVPRRPADQELLVALAAAQFDPGRTFLEAEVNGQLAAWLESITEPCGIDHVTLRRMLVDARFLVRTASGSAYRLNAEKAGEVEAIRDIRPADVLAQVHLERDARKRQREASPAGPPRRTRER